MDKNISGPTGRYFDSTGEYVLRTEGESSDDDLNFNSDQAHDSRSIGRERPAIYVPIHGDDPLLYDRTDEHTTSSSENPVTRIFSGWDNSFGSGDVKGRSDQNLQRFEKVVSSSSVALPQSTFQSERAETEEIFSPPPRQIVLKTRLNNLDQESPSPLTSSSSLSTVVVDRGEDLVIESSKRSEITIKPKSFNKKLDSSHGSKYQSQSSVSSNAGDKAAPGGNRANNVRPSRRTKESAISVVEAIVRDSREVIQAQVIEANEKELVHREKLFLNESEISQGAEKLSKLESIISNNSEANSQAVSPDDEDFHSLHEGPEVQNSTFRHTEDNQRENEEEELHFKGKGNSTKSRAISVPILKVTEEELQNADELEFENNRNVDQSKITAELQAATDIVDAMAVLMTNDNESAMRSEETGSSTLQRRASIHPHHKMLNDGRRRDVLSRSPTDQIENNPILSPEEREMSKSSRVKFANNSKMSNATSTSQRTGANSAAQSESKESVRLKTGMEKLKKKTTSIGPPSANSASGTRSIVHSAYPTDLKSQESFQDSQCERFNVLLRKDEYGYGMTMGNSQPVVVLAVRKGGVADRSGILRGDVIVKVNGTYVLDKIHEEVIKCIRSSGSFLDLTVQRPVQGNNGNSVNDEKLHLMLQSLSQSTAKRPKQTQSLKENIQRFAGDGGHQLMSKNQNQTSQSFSSVQKRGGGNDESTRLQSKSPHGSKRNGTQGGGGDGGGGGGGLFIIGMEADDLSEEEELPIDPVFNDVMILKQHVAHLAVFLNFLILSSDPAAMLFSIIADYYHAAVREASSATRWAFEIYTTFLVSEAPLKLSVNDGMVLSIESVLRNTKENELRTVFQPVENFVRETIVVKELKDFRKKLSIGLGSMYGVQDLRSNMDRISELRIVDSILSGHFEKCLANDLDSQQALAFCLATFFRHIGFFGGKNSALLETCPSFVFKDKDKKILRYKLKKNYESKGHVFNPHQCTSVTKCQNCERMIWGIGFQAYQCSNCEFVVDRRCANDVWRLCSATLRRPKDPRHIVHITGSIHNRPEASLKPAADIKTTSSEKVFDSSEADQQGESDNEIRRWPSSLPNISVLDVVSATWSGLTASSKLSDSDFEVEPELPPLSQVLSKDAIRRLKGKERKKQEFINELFYTERTHLRSLKVIDRFFLRPIREDGTFKKDFISLVFSNLKDVIELHSNLNKEFKKLRQKNEIVNDIGEVLVSRFSGDRGFEFKQIASKFCQDQLYTLGILRTKQKENPQLAQILQDATLNGYCGRQELKDLLPREMQRLTKYPLLIESIRSCTPDDTEEYEKLTLALKLSKDLLEHVNHAVRDCENFRRTQDMQSRLDRRPIENSSHPVLIEYRNLNLTQHKMIYDGVLTWRRPQRPLELHVALFEHFIVLLQKQDERLVLRCQNTTIEDVTFQCSPIIKLEHLLTKDVAVDKRAFFLINKSSDAPQVHELVAKSKEDKSRWCTCIKETVEKYHKQYSNEMARQRIHPLRSGPNVASSDTTDSSQRISQVDSSPIESAEEIQMAQTSELIPVLYETLSPDVDVCENFPDKADNASLLSELQEMDSVISKALWDKVKLLVDNHQAFYISDNFTPEELRIDEQNTNVKDSILHCLDEIKRLSRLGKGHHNAQRVEEVKGADSNQAGATAFTAEDGGDDGYGDVTISATELIDTNQKINRLLEILAVKIVDNDVDANSLDSQVPSIRNSLSALLAANADVKNSATRPGTRKPILRPTSYMAALKDADVYADSRIQPLSPDEQSPLHLQTSAVDNLLSSDDRFLTSPDDGDDTPMTLVADTFATDDDISII